MSINLSNEEAMVLSKLSYMNIADEASFKRDFKGATLKEVAIRLIQEKTDNKPRDFGSYGSLTNKEHFEMLQNIVDGKYPDLSNLVVKDYDNQNDKNGFVAYAFSDGNDTVCSFRGSEGNIVGDDGFLSTVDGKTGKDWVDNYYIGLRDVSSQFKSIDEFMKRNIVPGGQTFVTGHSKGGANAAYAAATFDGVTGFAFDGPGIGQCLSAEQIERLEKSGFINCVDQDDPVGSLLFHPEKRVFSQHNTVYVTDINGNLVLGEDGKPKTVDSKGAFAFGGHYTQGMRFNEDGSVILGERSLKSSIIEYTTKALWGINEITGQPLGDLIDSVKTIKTEIGIVMYLFSDNSISDKFTYTIKQISSLVTELISVKIDSIKVKFQRVKDCAVWINENILKKLGAFIINELEQFGNMMVRFGEGIKNAFDKFVDGAKDVWHKTQNYVTGLYNDIVDTGKAVGNAIDNFKKKASAAVSDFFKSVANGVKNFFGALGKAALNTWDSAVKKATKTADWIVSETKSEIKKEYQNFKEEANYLVTYTKKTLGSLGEKGKAVLKAFGKNVARGAAAFMSTELSVDLLRLSDLQNKLRNLERNLDERVLRILNEANRVTSDVERSYSEYYVRQQVSSVSRTCDQIREAGRRVCDSLQRKTNSLKYALEHYKQVEGLLCSEIRA